ncbi:hypothetical protein KCU95_g13613, partial [Aureobasidium melanogenum]
MRTAAGFLSAAALTGLAVASPAPQQLDFNQLAAAPTVQTAPVLNGVSNQTVTISSSAIAQSISAAVSTTATAVSSAPAQVVNKRSVEKRDIYNWWNCFFFGTQCGTSSSSTSTTAKSTSTSSTKTSSSSAAASTTAAAGSFYLKDANNNYLGCSSGQDGIASYFSNKASAVTFTIDSKTGYLYEAGQAYAANRGTSANPELTYFSTTSSPYSFFTCSQNTAQGWLECKANGVFQQAMTCNNDGNLYFGPTIPFWCSWVPLYYVPVSSASSTSSSSKAASTSSVVSSSSVVSNSRSSSSAAASSTSSGSATVNTVSGTSSSTTACPTTPEEGTYCGFINPEDPCAPQPDGYGPKVTPDTVSAFLAYPPFHSMASAAPTVVPSNNTAIGAGNAYQQTFLDLNASSSANSYLGLYTLTSYSVADCAAHCDSTALCTAFNIYIERDPSQNPSKNDSTAPTVWGYWCPNPSSITNFKCTLWGSNLDASTATNQGGWREDFQVVVTASNGYDATNTTLPPNVVDTTNTTVSATSIASSVLSSATPVSSKSSSTSSSTSSVAPSATASSGPTWSGPKTCGGKAINAPNYWMGSKFYPGPFNPQVCADYAAYQHLLNKQAAIAAGLSYFTPCNSFNAYYLHKNGIPHGTYCALYDASISTSYATYTGGWSGNDKYDCRQSYQYTRQTLDQGRC